MVGSNCFLTVKFAERDSSVKTDTVYKRAFNNALDAIASGDWTEGTPSENALCRQLGVSRTTVRKVLRRLGERAVIAPADGAGHRAVLREPTPGDYFADLETKSRAEYVENQFMEWMLRDDKRPGTLINELELARQFNVATASIREFLIRFSRFGLIEKRMNSGWLFKGFTREFALELFEIRVMFEMRSARLFSQQPPEARCWSDLRLLKAEHVELLQNIETRFHDFSELDSRFHRLISNAVPNRFISEFYDVIALIFHYHYQWNKQDEKQRNEIAIREHLAFIDGLQSGKSDRAEKACLAHLNSARETLLNSLIHAEDRHHAA